MAQSNEIKIVIGGDASSLTQASQQSEAAVLSLQKIVVNASAKIDAATNSIQHSFDEVGASKAAMDRIAESINAAADAAIKAGPKFDSLGGRLPLQDFNKFKTTFDRFKRDIESGFKFNISSGSIIPPIPASVPDSFNKTKAGANQAAAALTNVGRVAQDLPFGFVGIQNNLNPLLESFQRLKSETGSSKAALSALGQSLIGAGGVGLALSVVSSAILIYQNGIAGFNSKTKEAKDKADEFAKSIRSIALVQQEAAAGIEGQITQVTALSKVVSDSNKPYEQRKRALEELKDINKAYFGDLKLEDAATGALTKTVDEYTKALINNAIQKGFVDEIASVAKAVAKQDDIIAKSRLKLAQAQKAVKDAENFLPTGTRDPETAKQKKREEAGRKEAEALAELRTESEKVTQLLTQEALVRSQLNRAVEEGLKFKDLDTKGDKKEEDALKKRIEALKQIQSLTGLAANQQVELAQLEIQLVKRDSVKLSLSQSEVQQQIQGILEKAFPVGTFEFDTVVTTRVNKLEPSKIQKPEPLSKDQVKDISKSLGLETIEIPAPNLVFLNIKDKTKEALDQLNKSIQGAVEGGFSSIAEGIGESITGKGDLFTSLFTLLADGLQQLGKALLAYGLALLGFKIAIKTLNPIAAIAAGGLAIIAGAAVKAALPKFADGGIVNKATLGIFGERGPEVIMPLNKLPEILGKLSTDNQPAFIVNGNLRVSGTDLSLMLERVSGRRSRLG